MNPDPSPGLSDGDRRRLRQTGRILLVGGALAVVAVVTSALVGLTGQAGAIALLLVAALTCAVAALYTLATAFVDDLRDRRAARRRPLIGVGLLLLAGLLMAMVGAAASA